MDFVKLQLRMLDRVMSRRMYVSRKKSKSFRILAVFAVAVAFSLLAAFTWQKFYNPSTPLTFNSPNSADNSQSAAIASSGGTAESESADESSTEAGESAVSSEPEESALPPGPQNYEYALAESTRVDSAYFDDAAFVGDSITDGIKLYQTVPNATVVSHTGINLDKILYKQVIEVQDGKMITFLDALKAANPKKIYIMMGSNDIGFIAKEKFIDLYSQFVDAVKEQHPDSIIYIQAIFPVTATKSNTDPRYSNSKIDEYNVAIMQMAKAKGVYFVYTAEALKNENGALPEEASPKDGMHFTPTYYNMWYEYLRVHTAPNA